MLVIFIRAVILYFMLIIVIRLLGKRQIGEMGPTEFVVTMMVADLAAVPMQDLEIPLLSGIIPILTILAIEMLLSSLSYYSVSLRTLLSGKPVVLMQDGRILSESLEQTRITPDELTEHLRDKGIVDLNTVQYAILETNGMINAFVYPQNQPATAGDLGIEAEPSELPWTVISSGKLLRNNLTNVGYSEEWVNEILRSNGCGIKDVLLMTVTKSGTLFLSKQKGSL